MSQDKLFQLQEETAAFITERAQALGLSEPGKQLNVKVEMQLIPAPTVHVEIELRERPRAERGTRRGARPSLDRPLTDEEWTRLRALPYTPALRKILDFFAANGNQGVKGKTLVENEVLDQFSRPLTQFNLFLTKHGVSCAIRKTKKSERHASWGDTELRIFALGKPTK